MTETDWTEQRARMASTATGMGLFGHSTATERAAALGSPGAAFAGDQRIEGNGHLSWEANRGQRGVARVYQSQLRGDGEPGMSPLMTHLRGAATTEQWQ